MLSQMSLFNDYTTPKFIELISQKDNLKNLILKVQLLII